MPCDCQDKVSGTAERPRSGPCKRLGSRRHVGAAVGNANHMTQMHIATYAPQMYTSVQSQRAPGNCPNPPQTARQPLACSAACSTPGVATRMRRGEPATPAGPCLAALAHMIAGSRRDLPRCAWRAWGPACWARLGAAGEAGCAFVALARPPAARATALEVAAWCAHVAHARHAGAQRRGRRPLQVRYHSIQQAF